ncbi:SIMPL domain-containing protein [Winogradskyella sp. DF17]|uniref:SIMPL domain-containing protein n=1 Tax=Winogradskyella pelagia TaxID=2819984 RepID=A0ABS3T4Q6_9FLAO|nr:SIMPL domain-containing protein [Winogradskyella sp. DF17]MBO3117738.1 SIMPL domain-containing protein [Winogradskyella sp. DF17]
MKKNINSVLFSIAIVVAAYILGHAVINRNETNGEISVTGLGTSNFTSDLIVWEGSFSAEATNLKEAYDELEKSKKIIAEYLKSKGVQDSELVFNAVTSTKNQKNKYSSDGKYIGQEFLGYILTQSLKVESKNVETIEKISREITELLNKGINFYSNAPRYYYTQLADLKIEMISKATSDAHSRAENIASNSGSKLGTLKSAKMGIFQITGQNSSEDYSWGGTFNTASKKKTASITMKLVYDID